MADPNMADFQRRVQRIQKMRAEGYGFEAPGTLGRSYFNRPQAQRRAVLGPVILFLAAVMSVKGLMINEIGREAYEARVAGLQNSVSGVERLGGWMMQVDPVSEWIAVQIDALDKRDT